MATKFSKRDSAFHAFDSLDDEAEAEEAVRRFLFSYDFGAPPPARAVPDHVVDGQVEEAEAEPPPPPPLFSEEDLETAREEARVLGHAQGLKDAEESALHFQVLALESIADQMETLRGRQDAANAETHRMAAALAVAVVKKLLPRMAQEHGVAEVERLVSACLPHLLNEPRLILRVAPENADELRSRIEPLARDRGFDGMVVVMSDAAVGPADCRLEWDNGGAERDVDTLFQRIQDIVARNSERAPEPGSPPEGTAGAASAEAE
ncbi:MAG: FliH/SctL family protein [Rhodospirillaceae bacterium]